MRMIADSAGSFENFKEMGFDAYEFIENKERLGINTRGGEYVQQEEMG